MLALAAAVIVAAGISLGLLLSGGTPAETSPLALHSGTGLSASASGTVRQADSGWSVQLTAVHLPEPGPGQGHRPGGAHDDVSWFALRLRVDAVQMRDDVAENEQRRFERQHIAHHAPGGVGTSCAWLAVRVTPDAVGGAQAQEPVHADAGQGGGGEHEENNEYLPAAVDESAGADQQQECEYLAQPRTSQSD